MTDQSKTDTSSADDIPIAYVPDQPRMRETPEQLRARIPGWGADLDPADRPSHPKLRYAPESPLGGHEVPKTGVRNLCSIDLSRGHFSGCRSGNSQCAPLRSGSNRSRGTDGRSLGSRSAPQPGMRARNSSLDSASFGFSDV